jgi:hypothetical protein
MATVISYQSCGAWFWLVTIGANLASIIFSDESTARQFAAAVNARLS